MQLYQGTYLELVKEGTWEFVKRRNISGVVVLIPFTKKHEIVLVEQYRVPIQAKVIEYPAGMVGDIHSQESFEEAAQRELLEETGYQAGSLQFLMQAPLSPGLSSESAHFFLATELEKVGPGGGDESENIQVHPIPFANAHEWIVQRMQAGQAVDPKVFMGFYWLERYLLA